MARHRRAPVVVEDLRRMVKPGLEFVPGVNCAMLECAQDRALHQIVAWE